MNIKEETTGYIDRVESGEMNPIELATMSMTLLSYVVSNYMDDKSRAAFISGLSGFFESSVITFNQNRENSVH